MHLPRAVAILFLAAFLACPVAARSQAPGPGAAPPALKQRAATIDRVKSYAARLQSHDDAEPKINALMGIAAALCPHDRAAAREIFIEANEALLREERPLFEQSQIPDEETDWRKLDVNWYLRRNLRQRRQVLLGRAGACDASLTKVLSEGSPASRENEYMGEIMTQLRIAQESIDSDPARASDAIIAAAHHLAASPWARRPLNIYESPMYRFWRPLQRLRAGNAKLADRTFVRVLDQLRAAPDLHVSNLASLTAYFFGVGRMLNYQDAPIPHFTGEPPEGSDQAVRLFVNDIVDSVLRPVPDAPTRRAALTTALQFRDLVAAYAPQRLPELDAAVQMHTRDLGPQSVEGVKKEIALAAKPRDDTSNQGQRHAESQTDPRRRDAAFASLAVDLARKSEFARARSAADKVTDPEARAQLLLNIEMQEAGKVLESKRIERAVEMARAMPNNDIRIALWIAIAAARTASRDERARTAPGDVTAPADARPPADRDQALQELSRAIREAQALGDDRTPHLVIAAVNVLAPLDPTAAFETLRTIVEPLNNEEAQRRSESFRPSHERPLLGADRLGWRVRLKDYSASGVIRYPGFDTSFAKAVESLLSRDFDALEALVLSVELQKSQSEALVVLSRKLLSSLPRSASSNRPQ